MKSQKEKIIDYLMKHGTLTTFDAFTKLKISKLTTRISELRREGYDIQARRIDTKNEDGRHIFYFVYELVDDGTVTHGERI